MVAGASASRGLGAASIVSWRWGLVSKSEVTVFADPS